ncbi:unnamed protein product [Heligmosomoides polygyrus]|uniref:CCHC-type domain-containing protein n=1 Tax=Heligmosomoides polygyrus TaxID=6339 RepID=A0A3P7X848_HELPZ|nr:unnamed protein product [Heligmosomoides polygyrus]
MRTYFEGPQQRYLARQKLAACKQEPTETTTAFADRLKILVRSAMAGLDSETQNELALAEFVSRLQAAADRLLHPTQPIVEVHALDHRHSPRRPEFDHAYQRPEQSQGGNQRRPFRQEAPRRSDLCYNCGGTGHLSRQCPSPPVGPRRNNRSTGRSPNFRERSNQQSYRPRQDARMMPCVPTAPPTKQVRFDDATERLQELSLAVDRTKSELEQSKAQIAALRQRNEELASSAFRSTISAPTSRPDVKALILCSMAVCLFSGVSAEAAAWLCPSENPSQLFFVPSAYNCSRLMPDHLTNPVVVEVHALDHRHSPRRPEFDHAYQRPEQSQGGNQRRPFRQEAPRRSDLCYNCGGTGHFSRQCPSSPVGPRRDNRSTGRSPNFRERSNQQSYGPRQDARMMSCVPTAPATKRARFDDATERLQELSLTVDRTKSELEQSKAQIAALRQRNEELASSAFRSTISAPTSRPDVKALILCSMAFPSAPFGCCSNHEAHVVNCYLLETVIHARHGTDAPQAAIGDLSSCQYMDGVCILADGSAFIWKKSADLSTTNPTLTMRNLLGRQDVGATHLGNGFVQIRRCIPLPMATIRLLPFNSSCFEYPRVELPLPSGSKWQAFLNPVTGVISSTATAADCASTSPFYLLANRSLSRFSALDGKVTPVSMQGIETISSLPQLASVTVAPKLTIFHNLILNNFSEIAADNQPQEMWIAAAHEKLIDHVTHMDTPRTRTDTALSQVRNDVLSGLPAWPVDYKNRTFHMGDTQVQIFTFVVEELPLPIPPTPEPPLEIAVRAAETVILQPGSETMVPCYVADVSRISSQ